MNQDSTKVYIIEQLLTIDDDVVLAEVRQLLEGAAHRDDYPPAPPVMSEAEYIRRYEAAEEDIRTGNTIPHEEVVAYFTNRLPQKHED